MLICWTIRVYCGGLRSIEHPSPVMAANEYSVQQIVEYCEAHGLCKSYVPATVASQEDGHLSLVLADGSRLVCEHAAVRPAPPPSTLQSTQVGQVLEWKDGDRWRTVVCVQDAQLNAEHLQKIKVVLPENMDMKRAGWATLRPCLTYTPGRSAPWQPAEQDTPRVLNILVQRMATFPDSTLYNGVRHASPPGGKRAPPGAGQQQQLWQPRPPGKDTALTGVTLRPWPCSPYMVVAARGHDLLRRQAINFDEELWQEIRTYLQLTEDQEPKLVPYSNTFNISPDDFDSSAGLLAAAGHAPGGSQLSQGGAGKKRGPSPSHELPPYKRVGPPGQLERRAEAGPGAQGRSSSRRSRLQLPSMQLGAGPIAAISQPAPGNQSPRPPTGQLPPTVEDMPQAPAVAPATGSRPAKGLGLLAFCRPIDWGRGYQDASGSTSSSSGSLRGSGEGDAVPAANGAASVRSRPGPSPPAGLLPGEDATEDSELMGSPIPSEDLVGISPEASPRKVNSPAAEAPAGQGAPQGQGLPAAGPGAARTASVEALRALRAARAAAAAARRGSGSPRGSSQGGGSGHVGSGEAPVRSQAAPPPPAAQLLQSGQDAPQRCRPPPDAAEAAFLEGRSKLMRRLQALSSSVSGGNPRGSGWGGGSGHAGSGAASDHSPGGQGGASKRGQQAAGRGQREEAQQEHASKRGSLLSPEGSGSGAGGNASQQQQEQQQQQQQQQQQRPKRLTIKDFLPAEGSSMPLFLLASDKDSGGTKHLIVGRKLGCGGQAVVLHVTEPVLDWEGFLVSGSLAGWKGVLPLEQQRRAGSAAAGSSSAAAAAGAGGSGQAAGVQYALKVALPWELTKDYERNPGPLAFQAYLLKADRGARREQRYLDQLHAPREGYVSRGSQHIIKCFQRGRVQLPGCGYPLPALLLEYCPGGSLWDKGKVDAATAACYIDQVMRGLQAIHQQGLSHSDLKGANCLLDAQGKVKLCDLGLLEEYTQGVCSDTLEGLTPAYRAPEMKVGHFHDQRVDVWMLGCLLLELRSGKLPFKYLEGRPDEEERRRREELDNPESDYYQLLGPEEEKMVKECLKVMEVRPTLSLLRDRCEMYFMLAQEAV